MDRFFLMFVTILTIFSQVESSDLTIETIVFGHKDFQMSTVRGIQWTPDGEGYVYISDGDGLSYYDVKTGSVSVYIDSKDKILDPVRTDKRFQLPQYYWAPNDQDKILVPKSSVDNDGNILSSDLYLYHRKTKEFLRLTNDAEIERDPVFSPDGKFLTFLKNNNLFLLNIGTRELKQLTDHGTDKILIGRFDWVYEEEFGIRTGYFWSPNSDKIAFFELTDAKTDRFPIVDFIPVNNAVEFLPYPKAGADNSTVRIGIINLKENSKRYMDVSSNKNELIPRIKWTNNNNQLAIMKMNRDQDYLNLYFSDVRTGKSQLVLREEEKNGWVDIHDDLTFVNDDYFIWKSRKDGYQHLYKYDMNGKLLKQLTKGNWEITSINGIDLDKKRIYFTAAKNSPLEREFYSVDFNGKTLKMITRSNGFHRINLSPNNVYFLDYFSASDKAPTVDLMTTGGRLIRNLIKNSLEGYYSHQLTTKEIFKFKASDGTDLNAYFIKPKNFNPKKKYPVMMFQYSGPGSQRVLNNWSFQVRDRWHHYLAQNGILVFCADGRGTGNRGKDFEFMVNHNLGDYETKDQVDAANYLRSLPYINKNKIGIWGWSYGAYTSSLAVMKYPDEFNLAIAVAPVSNWRNYDTIYTERFMSTPDKNSNYTDGSPINYVKNLSVPYLLIHGTGDDNVHVSNSVQLVEKLVHYQKQFDVFFYPRAKHGLTYNFSNAYPHLYQMMSNFVFKHFK